jgi:hypothetical protein
MAEECCSWDMNNAHVNKSNSCNIGLTQIDYNFIHHRKLKIAAIGMYQVF